MKSFGHKLGVITAMALVATLPERKLTKEFLESEVKEKHFTQIGERITHCRIVTHSGFEFTGESAVVDVNNFDKALGEKYAYEQALDGMWEPYGFWLHKALADYDNRLQPPSEDDKLEETYQMTGDELFGFELAYALAENGDTVTRQSTGLTITPEDMQAIDWQIMGEIKVTNEVTDLFNFGVAVEQLKQGGRVARSGWNGKGMFLYYVPENKYPASRNEHGTMVGVFEDDMIPYGAYIAMKTAQNNVVPWLASQTDVLANDWVILS